MQFSLLSKAKMSFLIILLVLFFFFPFMVGSYILHLTIIILIFTILSLSVDILARTGQVSVGQAAMFGIGAYTSALLFTKFSLTPVLGIVIGGFCALLVAIGLGAITLRMKGIYFSIATICFAETLQVLALMARNITGGAIGVSVPPIFGGNRIFAYYLILSMLIFAVLIIYLINNSKFYYAFTAIRENEDVANVIGINPTKYKIFAFMISAFFAGCAGGFYVHYITYIIPYEVFALHISVACLVMPIFGGLYTLEGPIIGAISLKIIEEYLRTAMPYGHMIVYGIVLVIVILFLPRGIVGFWKQKILPLANKKLINSGGQNNGSIRS